MSGQLEGGSGQEWALEWGAESVEWTAPRMEPPTVPLMESKTDAERAEPLAATRATPWLGTATVPQLVP
jgi:hypothetical protein